MNDTDRHTQILKKFDTMTSVIGDLSTRIAVVETILDRAATREDVSTVISTHVETHHKRTSTPPKGIDTTLLVKILVPLVTALLAALGVHVSQ
mgnify:CR=1 FL=1|jgi:hypothetical protein